jgi:hypothetical protein
MFASINLSEAFPLQGKSCCAVAVIEWTEIGGQGCASSLLPGLPLRQLRLHMPRSFPSAMLLQLCRGGENGLLTPQECSEHSCWVVGKEL